MVIKGQWSRTEYKQTQTCNWGERKSIISSTTPFACSLPIIVSFLLLSPSLTSSASALHNNSENEEEVAEGERQAGNGSEPLFQETIPIWTRLQKFVNWIKNSVLHSMNLKFPGRRAGGRGCCSGGWSWRGTYYYLLLLFSSKSGWCTQYFVVTFDDALEAESGRLSLFE